ncbi:heterokaryon incompatibility protein-domain-containing protein [Dactylonectria macrodidyma]|uniref:Heterokaryon incompatibility protein-domain-containing protein n=1 Tax=Dactylonectria macrodidyma TaxID=307937 RepID=A0A9P9DVB9_9HYPO|nr:heterokaryon incompatibility protein-domain-containing protein [Dactylonectria macrodidyma]
MTATWTPLYEHYVDENTEIDLHQLCATCTQLKEESHLLRSLFSGDKIRLAASETFSLCTAAELKAGYLNACHLCALLWARAEGYLLDPDTPAVKESHVILELQARNFAIEHTLETQGSALGKFWRKHVPRFIGETGVVIMQIRKTSSQGPPSTGKLRPRRNALYIYRSSNPDLNQKTLRSRSEPISSKHEKGLACIQSWYNRCSRDHAKCTAYSHMVAPTNQLPSRLLDLRGDKVRLECDMRHQPQLQYTTLSHIWGSDPKAYLCLTKACLEDFKKEILPSSLPTKYLEAIRITRALGFQYLWIDSLCIIQDSDDDWANEALNMASVYGRTACNISFVFPTADESNKKHLRDPRLGVPCLLFQPQTNNANKDDAAQSNSLVVQHVPGFISRFWSPNTYKDYWPLLSRAWAIQERLLCPRNLYYGQDRLMWECCEMVEDEFWGPLDNSARSKGRFYAIFAGVENHASGSRSMFESFRGQWRYLIHEYRIAELSFETDRIIAFAGIVGAVQSHTGFVYLAGVWKEFAEFDLLWVVHPPPPESDFYQREIKKELEAKPVPSWSWFKVPPHPPLASEARDTIAFHVYSAMYARSEHTLYKMRVVLVEHPRLASNPASLLHDFSGLSITLKARKIPCTLEWDGSILRLLPQGRYQLSNSYMEPKDGMHYHHDAMYAFPDFPVPVGAFMVLTMLEAWVLKDDKESTYDMANWPESVNSDGSRTLWQYAGLVVVPADQSDIGKECWKRIGVFMFSDFVDGKGIVEVPFDMSEEEDEVVLV